MGFLVVGSPLDWKQSEAVRQYVKRHGLHQFLNIWRGNKERRDSELKWGEEVEFTLVDIGKDTKGCRQARVYVAASDVIEELRRSDEQEVAPELRCLWQPEFGNHMVEAVPREPYNLNVESILLLESRMRLRRARIQFALPLDFKPPFLFVSSQTAFPRFGLGDFLTPSKDCVFNYSVTGSAFIPDELITPHPRFSTLVANIRSRRKANPVITIPVYPDVNTYQPTLNSCNFQSNMSDASSVQPNVINAESNWSLAGDSLDRFEVEKLARRTVNPIRNQIYMDCFAFGMGMSCLQATFSTPDISSARYLYDQLAVLAPLFLALTASTPVLRGLLADTDTRWSTLEQAVDCRTAEEMKSIPKSRYSGVSLYISDDPKLTSRLSELNDTDAPIDAESKSFLMQEGLDEVLATHMAHLWIRDPMVIFSERVEVDDTQSSDHFENIQSTNWNSVRFKPPPSAQQSAIGWRVEFRTPEVQLTDFDNAAICSLICVLVQIILAKHLDLYIPMSMNDVNMKRSWKKDAITKQKFWFRRDIAHDAQDKQACEMSLHEILAGSPRLAFGGLIPMCKEFVASELAAGRCQEETSLKFGKYCDLLEQRASGLLMTTAQFLRKFVTVHPNYQKDSIVTPTISHDLTVLSVNLGLGIWLSPALHGDAVSLIRPTPLPYMTNAPELSSGLSPFLMLPEIVKFIQLKDVPSSCSVSSLPSNIPFVLLTQEALFTSRIEDGFADLCPSTSQAQSRGLPGFSKDQEVNEAGDCQRKAKKNSDSSEDSELRSGTPTTSSANRTRFGTDSPVQSL